MRKIKDKQAQPILDGQHSIKPQILPENGNRMDFQECNTYSHLFRNQSSYNKYGHILKNISQNINTKVFSISSTHISISSRFKRHKNYKEYNK